MNDQERIIEEKKKQIEAKLAAEAKQVKEVVAPKAKPEKKYETCIQDL